MLVSGQLQAPGHFTPAKEPPVSTEQEDGCAPKNIDTLESRKYLTRAGNWKTNPRSPGPQPSQYTDCGLPALIDGGGRDDIITMMMMIVKIIIKKK